MTLTRALFMLVLSVLVTIPIVWLIPHARKSRFFDWLLWAATALLAFLGAWFALGYAENSTSAWFNTLVVADLPVLPILLGAVVGALVLNLSLWVIDRFAPLDVAEYVEPDEKN